MSSLKRGGRSSGLEPTIVIEHLEEHLSKWILAEYEHACSMAKRVIVTNAGACCKEIGRICNCIPYSIASLRGELYAREEQLIILDPQAKDELKPEDIGPDTIIVVGGILGDHPPRGRTRQLLSARFPKARKRNLGRHQLSIDGAVYVALRIAEGVPLRDIPVRINPTITINLGDYGSVEVTLPFAYPLRDNGELVISQRLLKHLAAGLGFEEFMLAKGKTKKCW